MAPCCARRLRERVWQYYIVRALFAAFVDYNIERMGGMGREMHTCAWASNKCLPVPQDATGRRKMYELMQHEDQCNAACMDTSGMEIRYPQCSQFGGSQTCSCAQAIILAALLLWRAELCAALLCRWFLVATHTGE